MTVPSTTTRQTFYHWVLVDIPANVMSLKEGAEFDRPRAARQAGDPAAVGMRGLNMFTDGLRRQRRDEGQILRL